MLDAVLKKGGKYVTPKLAILFIRTIDNPQSNFTPLELPPLV
jgi:hypothetical protein